MKSRMQDNEFGNNFRPIFFVLTGRFVEENYGKCSIMFLKRVFGLSTELITKGKLATVKRFEC